MTTNILNMVKNRDMNEIKSFVSSLMTTETDEYDKFDYIGLLLTGCCQFNYMDGVKYIVAESDIELGNLYAFNNSQSFRVAAKYGNFEIVEFLLTDPNLNAYPDIKAKNYEAFKYACYNQDEKMIKLFINDLDMEIPYPLAREIDRDNDLNMDGKLYEIIDKRDNAKKLNHSLNEELEEKPAISKLKI